MSIAELEKLSTGSGVKRLSIPRGAGGSPKSPRKAKKSPRGKKKGKY